jgi:hypothetical protein
MIELLSLPVQARWKQLDRTQSGALSHFPPRLKPVQSKPVNFYDLGFGGPRVFHNAEIFSHLYSIKMAQLT